MDSNSLTQIYIDPSQLIVTNKGIVRAEFLSPEMLLKSTSGLQRIIEVNKLEKVCKKILFANGTSSILELNSFLVDETGNPIRVGQIKKEDIAQFCFFNFFPEKENFVSIGWVDKKMAVPIRIPKEMNEDFAYWLGIVAARGKTGTGQRSLLIEIKKDNNLEKVFGALTKKIFNLTVDKREYSDKEKRIFLRINSSNLVQYVQKFLGRNLNFKKPPVAISESSVVVQLAFIRGLSLKGFIDKNQVVIFSGTSKYLSDFITTALTSIGYGIHRRELQSYNKTVYVIHIQYWHPHSLPLFIDFFDIKQTQNSKQQYLKLSVLEEISNKYQQPLDDVVVSYGKCNYYVEAHSWISLLGKKESKEHRIGTKHPGYKSIAKAKEMGARSIKASSLQDSRVFEQIVHIVEVKDVEIIKKEMIEITLSNNSGIILDGLIVL